MAKTQYMKIITKNKNDVSYYPTGEIPPNRTGLRQEPIVVGFYSDFRSEENYNE